MNDQDAEPASGEDAPIHHDSALQRRLEAESAGLGAALGEQMRSAPWYMGSVGIHLIIFALLMLLPTPPPPEDKNVVVINIEQYDEPEELETPPEEETEIDEFIEIVDVENVQAVELTNEVVEFVETTVDVPVENVVEVEAEVFELDVAVDTISIEVPNARAASPRRFAARGSRSGRQNALRGNLRPRDVKIHEQRVNDALEWLKAHQESNGSWNAQKYGGESDKTNVAVTSFATLAFLGAGHSPTTGKYRDEVKKAVEWLLSQQKADGSIGPHSYVHGIALMAVTEAYGMSNDRRMRERAQKAVDYAARTQNKGDGGWDYKPNNAIRSDFSVAGWYIMGLKSAEQAGLDVPKATMDGALKFTNLMTELKDLKPDDPFAGSAQGRYSTDGQGGNKNGGTPALTAVSLTTLQFLKRPRSDERVRIAGQTVIRNGVPEVGLTHFYRWYYAALGLFQYGADPELREDPTMKPYVDAWRAWATPMVDTLFKMQVRTGSYKELKGSWNPETEASHGRSWGRVGQTAIAALMLEVFYRYDIVQQSRRSSRT